MSDRNAGDEPADLVDAVGRVATAVDVDEPREVGEVGGLGGADGRVEGGRARRRRRRIRARSRSPRWAVYGPRALGILGGPCAWSRSACSRDPTSTGWRRWSRSRSRSAGGGPGTASASPGATPLVRLGATVPPRRTGRARSGRLVDWVRRLRVDHGEGRGGVVVHRSSDPGHWIVTFPWTGAERAHSIAEAAVALTERDVSTRRARPADGPSTTRAIARWHATIADARTTPPAWIRDADRRDAGRLDHRHERQEHRDPADDPHPRPGRAAGRDDDLRRRPRRRADGRARRLDRARRRVADPRPVRPRRRGPRDRPRRPRPARHGLRVERRRRRSRTSAPTTSTSRASTRCPSWPRSSRPSSASTKPDGWCVLNADDPHVAAIARRVRGARRVVHARAGRLGARVRRHAAPAADGRTSVDDGWSSSSSRAAGRRRSSRSRASRSRSAAWPGTTSRTRSPPRPRRAGLGLDDRSGRRRPAPTSGPRRSASPGRLNLFRVGSTDRDRRLRPQRGRRRGRARRRRGDRRRRGRPGGAGHRDHRDRRRSARRHAPRHRPDRRHAGPAGRDQGDAQVPPRTVARGRSSGRCWPA